VEIFLKLTRIKRRKKLQGRSTASDLSPAGMALV
jgi:hypothetical protein